MSEAGSDADRMRRRRIQVQTRWLAALLQGLALAAFIAVFLRGQILGPSVPTQIASAFIAATIASHIVWPLASDPHAIKYWRAALCGFLVVPVGGLLWAVLGSIAHMVEARSTVQIDMADVLMMPLYLLLLFGWGTVPLVVGAALAAAAWGNARLRRAGPVA
jgi:hypothetical protein